MTIDEALKQFTRIRRITWVQGYYIEADSVGNIKLHFDGNIWDYHPNVSDILTEDWEPCEVKH